MLYVETREVEPETTVIYAETLEGDSLYGTWGYTPRTVEKAVEILVGHFDYDEEIAKQRVETMTAQEADERGLINFVTIAD